MTAPDTMPRNRPAAFSGGAIIGALGGLIGLGGAEFRLPLLIGAFQFGALEAVILNKAMSLVVVASALPFRAHAVPWSAVVAHWPVIVNLLAGSLLGAWRGAGWATRARPQLLYRVIAGLLVVIAMILLFGHSATQHDAVPVTGIVQVTLGVIAGFIIGTVAALMGVAGGELLIPTLVLLFGIDIKLAGSLSLVVSLPTMLTGFARYSQDSSFAVLRKNRAFVLLMSVGSIGGAFVGGQLVGIVSSAVLLPVLAAILVISSVKVWQHS
ncbi:MULTISPECIES: sulfite exporter TauE/SafE family protein [Burkholderiaceae]|uniref:Probable membrane transporter protein n=1 Tax=Paraburkholderia aromaticivorans TaxID=2026199 RepID=A0A248VZB1_9BURK|nr:MULTISPECIES: sulfite exporter TauE/SafE family protein [Burkholderiaceae]ASW03730.1 permease [Paraburkholderia aromaticivorans]MBR8008589.1 sulfite exporter TauE/SafE family protein [Burkholderia vietnamiensis]MBR8054665.1 sulfite exporter TauE/SafE family protein [Burkholderia vietnamiensis]HDR9179366.1 sulfite exporter TauE/SafE family protein [Burkholderia vietnamiensis]